MALRPRHGIWARAEDVHTPVDAARALAWGGPDDPGDWQPVTRTFRDGHAETWYAADARLGAWGPDGARRLVVATADPGTLPDKATWYLVTNLPRPGGPRQEDSPWPAAGLAEIVRIYGMRHWVEQCVQAGQGRARLGRLPGPLRHRDPPPPGAGQLRVLLLLGLLAHLSAPARAPAPASPRREGAPPAAAPDMPGHPSGTKLAPRAARRPQPG